MHNNYSPQRAAPLFLKVVGIVTLVLGDTLAGYGQGSLTPPSAPTPTMKSLDQVEARIIVNSANCLGDSNSSFIISQPGSYYLTGNITGVSGKNGITILAASATLDLNGFDLIGASGAVDGVASTQQNVTVRNGTVCNWPGNGINLNSINGMIERIEASGNGTGLNTTNVIVDHCSVTGNNFGITVNNGQMINCSIMSNNGLGAGVHNSVVTNCLVQSNVNGMITGDSVVKESICEGNNSNGIEAQQHSIIVGNRCAGNGGQGIVTSGGGSRIEGNLLTGNGTGLSLGVANCVVRANVVMDNTTNYSLSAGGELELLISQLPVTINVPAKVTLAGTLTGGAGLNGIIISSDNVTVDLGGHALVGVGTSLDGILVSGARNNVSVRNGIVRNWGGDGIDASAAGSGGAFSDLELNGNVGDGLHTASRQLISKVNSYSNNGDGINASGANKISACLLSLNGGWGITSTGVDSTIEGCLVNQNTTGGIQVSGSQSFIIGNTVDNHTAGDGLFVSGSRCRIDGNHLSRRATGLHVTGTLNVIVRNSVSQSGGTTYNVVAGNDAGPLGTAAASTSPWANFQ